MVPLLLLLIGREHILHADARDAHAVEVAVRGDLGVAEVDVVEARTREADVGECRAGKREIPEISVIIADCGYRRCGSMWPNASLDRGDGSRSRAACCCR